MIQVILSSLTLLVLLAACAGPPAGDAATGGPPREAAGSPPSAAPSGPGAAAAAALAALPPEKILDLSRPYDEETIYWPTADPFRLSRDSEGINDDGYFYASFSFTTSEHGGTHLDAPYHFNREGWTVDRIPTSALIGPAVVIDVRAACAADPDHAVSAEEIRQFEAEHATIPEGALVILYTGWGARWPDRKRYMGDDTPGDASNLHFPGLSPGGARYLAEKRRIAAVGIDTASIDPGPSRDFQAHRILAAANIFNLENLARVERLPPTGATLIPLPMKIGGGTGGPVRVVAILP